MMGQNHGLCGHSFYFLQIAQNQQAQIFSKVSFDNEGSFSLGSSHFASVM